MASSTIRAASLFGSVGLRDFFVALFMNPVWQATELCATVELPMPKRRPNPVDEEGSRLAARADSLATTMGVPVYVRSVEPKIHPTGIPFGKEKVESFALNFGVVSGKWPGGILDRTYVSASDLSDEAVEKRLRDYLGKVAEKLRSTQSSS